MSVTLQEKVYFGVCWAVQDVAGLTAPLGGGYTGPQIIRNATGDFVAGIVEKQDSQGNVTDVILSFNGIQPSTADGAATVAGLPSIEAERAVMLYESLWSNPRYDDATIHVTGGSMGAALTQYLLAYSLATHGFEVTDARAEFLAFASPPTGGQAAIYFGLDPHDLDGRYTNYTVLNDWIQFAGNSADRVGTTYWLPAREQSGPDSAVTGEDSIAMGLLASHGPSNAVAALGLPDWLTVEQKAQVVGTFAEPAPPGGYDSPGLAPLVIDGDTADNVLVGLDGNDVIIGDLGRDTLTGGGGADTFQFDTIQDSATFRPDSILDFQQGDRIDLSAIDAIQSPNYFLPDVTNNDFAFIGSHGFTAPGQVRAVTHGNTTTVYGNVDHDLGADFAITLIGRVPLDVGDFIL